MKTKEQTIKGKNGPCSFELTKEYFWGQDEESGVYFKFTVTKNNVTIAVGNMNFPINEKEEIAADFKSFEEYEEKCSGIVNKIGSSLPRLIKEDKYEPYLVDLSYEFGKSKLVFGSKYAELLYARYYEMVTKKFAYFTAHRIMLEAYQEELKEADAEIEKFNNKKGFYKKMHKAELMRLEYNKKLISEHIQNCEKAMAPYVKFREEIYKKSLKKYLSEKTSQKMEIDVLELAIPEAFDIIVGPFGFEDVSFDEKINALTKGKLDIPRIQPLISSAFRYLELKQKTA